jgi:metallo-beta-lactamase superfamily protein
MITRRHLLAASAASLCSSFIVAHASAETPAARVTVLYDAFGKPSPLKTGWGYASLIEYGGRRILFDTGGNGADFAHNVNTLGIDLKNLDFVVLSHRHNDHTAGLTHVLQENASVPVYTPVEGAGFNAPLSAPLMNMLRRPIASLPEELRYYGGNLPAEIRSEPPWPAHFIQITATKEVLPGSVLDAIRDPWNAGDERSLSSDKDAQRQRPHCRLLPSGNRNDSGGGGKDRSTNLLGVWWISSRRRSRHHSDGDADEIP